MQDIDPWMSAADVDAGARWNHQVQDELGTTRFGVICLTHENQAKPWILFEAGALAKSIDGTFVCPYLLDLDPSEIAAGPLTQFQAKRANEKETLELVKSINAAQNEGALPEDKLERAFKLWWPYLQRDLESISPAPSTPERRNAPEILEELVVTIRDIRRDLGDLHGKMARNSTPQLPLDTGWYPLTPQPIAADKNSLFRTVSVLTERERRILREVIDDLDSHVKAREVGIPSEHGEIPDSAPDPTGQ